MVLRRFINISLVFMGGVCSGKCRYILFNGKIFWLECMGHRKGYDTPGKFDKFVIMISRVISVPGEQARYNLVVMGEYEYANPIEKIGEGVMQMHMMKD